MAIRVKVKIQPKAARNEIAGMHGDAVKIRITAAPEKGKANKELIHYLSSVLGLRGDQVRLVSGQLSRHKIIEISGLEYNEICEKLNVDTLD